VRRRLDRRTAVLGGLSLAGAAAGVASEWARVWRRGSAPLPPEPGEFVAAAEEAAREAVEIARVGYRESPAREAALLNLLASFLVTFGVVRTSTHIIRRRGRFGPFRDFVAGGRHIHHFVPGIAMMMVSGTAAILTRDETIEPKLALVFGAGMGLTLDESALLLELEDVYWTPEGLLGVQIALAATALIAALALGLRFTRRGEELVLEDGQAESPAEPTAGPAAS
jgi:hypothetical protein